MYSQGSVYKNRVHFEFSGEDRFQIFTQKWLLGNMKYFVSQTEIIKVKWF